MAMMVYSSMHIISRPGYEMLINQSIEKAQYFAGLINADDDFELMTEPELCLLTYRYAPAIVQQFLSSASKAQTIEINQLLDELTKYIQKYQREAGKSFVSRTRIEVARYSGRKIIVFRVVLANPLTTNEILQQVLIEQKQIAATSLQYLPEVMAKITR